MIPAPLPQNEEERLAKLLSYNVLDTDTETAYDDLTLITSHICQTPIALVSLVDRNRQWFKSKVGIDAEQTPRDIAFCAHAILESDLFVVPDATQDERFADNPLVAGAPEIRFYAGAPLTTFDGFAVGTLCVIDYQPRTLTSEQHRALEALGRQVTSQLELRLKVEQLNREMAERKQAQADLFELNQQLEERVAARTAELQFMNNQLLDEIAIRQQAEQALQQSQAELQGQTEQLRSALEQLGQAQSKLVQTEKISALGLMVAGIAHELNNPIGFISGNLNYGIGYVNSLLHLVRLYQDEYPDPPAAVQDAIADMDLEYLAEDLPKLMTTMQVGTKRMREIVCSLKNFARADAQKCLPANLHEGIDSTLMILRHRLKAQAERPEIVVRQIYDELPPVVCHIGQLSQVFMNLISNAVDAFEEAYEQGKLSDEPTITILTSRQPDGCISIAIKDNGPGISPEVQSRIFQPFFTTKGVGKGTGLGLSISHQIITEGHQGYLTCHSMPGEGTEFHIDLPGQKVCLDRCP
ncbi:MAG TPA: ATP-binding protein [Trichocoleus sp.]